MCARTCPTSLALQMLNCVPPFLQSYLFCAFLVDRFDEQDGLILLMDLLSEKYLMSSGV
jgi:hypothetical protein